MPEATLSSIEKALALNLDPLKYGTIVEIGAGQEVARWFFQAGAAAGTIAKSMSAYDMVFSDQIYGAATDGRYVSKSRLERMLEREFELVVSRIEDHRPDDTTFFSFANTVAAQGFKKRSECHGWLGISFQSSPKAPPETIILHVRMLDNTNIEQQEALGILGVNLIHGAFFHGDNPEELLLSLMDNLKQGRVEIDLVDLRGPKLGKIDNRLMALELVKSGLTPAAMFDPDGNAIIPADALYRHSVLTMRGKFYTVQQTDIDLFAHAKMKFEAQSTAPDANLLCLAELTMAQLANDNRVDTHDFLSRVTSLSNAGYHVLISKYFRYFSLRQYLTRYTREPVAIVTNIDELGDIFREDYYEGVEGGILEGLGKLFPDPTTAYVYPKVSDGVSVGLDNFQISDHLRPLVSYLRQSGQIVPVEDYE